MGQRTGVDEIVAEAAGGQHETVYSRIQIVPAGALRLEIAGGDLQTARPGSALDDPVQVRVTDVNDLPYPGNRVQVLVSEGGTVDRTEAVTDENGTASFRWTPGTATENELRATLAGGATAVATALGLPRFAAGAVVNAASFAPGLTPGGIATLFGLNLAGASTAEILLNGQAVPVFYSSTHQVNFFVPFGTAGDSARLTVRNPAGESDPIQVGLTALQPGIFFDTATGYGAVLTAGTGQPTQTRPVSRGETVEIYATGLGVVNSQSFGLQTTTTAPQVLVGGSPAEVTFSGLAPGFTGLYQINAQVPAGAPAGKQTLVVIANGLRSNEVQVEVR
jgi:uncharacterized protein (TIGR03437 family)